MRRRVQKPNLKLTKFKLLLGINIIDVMVGIKNILQLVVILKVRASPYVLSRFSFAIGYKLYQYSLLGSID